MNNISNYKKKFYSLLESEMGNVKPLVNEQNHEEYNKTRTDDYGMLMNKRFKQFLFNHFDNYISDGLYIDRHPEDEQHIWFVNESNNRIIFRYDYKDRLLKYDEILLSNVLGMLSSRPPELYEILGEYITEWANESLVPIFSKEVKKMCGYNFKIKESYNDEEFDGNDPFNEENN